jgi:hypothetical protein
MQKKIKGNSPYFAQKYGTSNPLIDIKGKAKELWGPDWAKRGDIYATMLYHQRAAYENLPYDLDDVYYGEIDTGEFGSGEVVHGSELEDI